MDNVNVDVVGGKGKKKTRRSPCVLSIVVLEQVWVAYSKIHRQTHANSPLVYGYIPPFSHFLFPSIFSCVFLVSFNSLLDFLHSLRPYSVLLTVAPHPSFTLLFLSLLAIIRSPVLGVCSQQPSPKDTRCSTGTISF